MIEKIINLNDGNIVVKKTTAIGPTENIFKNPKIKKDFWDMSWNPVWGCRNKCEYCYARRMANRIYKQIALKEMEYNHKDFTIYNQNFNKSLYNKYLSLCSDLKTFIPTWLESNYVRKFPKKPSIIFVNSMSDPAYWEQSWYEKILKRITENFQHTFVILTKNPYIYLKYKFPHNTIIGVSTPTQEKFDAWIDFFKTNDKIINSVLFSIEPIQEKINIQEKDLLYIDWIHVGQESGNRKNRVKATPEMIKPFYDIKDTAVFMKENIRGIYHPDLKKEFPV